MTDIELTPATEEEAVSLGKPVQIIGKRKVKKQKRVLSIEEQKANRIENGKKIFASGNVKLIAKDQWHVGSQSNPAVYYVVDKKGDGYGCDCDDFARVYGRFFCKHCYSVKMFNGEQIV